MAAQSTKDSLKRMVKGASKGVKTKKGSKKGYISRDVAKKIDSQLKTRGRTIQKIPLDMIDLGDNVRQFYDNDAIAQLALSLDNDGLIQFPTLGLKKEGAYYKLVCRNGHRRILAAKKLRWEQIECVILPFNTAMDELYHSLNANLREQVFYLDIAEAYQKAHDLGESDESIAKRVGVNKRTIGWYRRLSVMSPSCKALVRQNPQVFTPTWAIKLARKGELPPAKDLEKMMKRLLGSGVKAVKEGPKPIIDKRREVALNGLRRQFKGAAGKDRAKMFREFLSQLVAGGVINQSSLSRVDKEIFGARLSPRKTQAKRRA